MKSRQTTSIVNFFTANSCHKGFGMLCILVFLAASQAALAQISVSGLSDKTVYADSVTFTIVSATGYDYTAELNDSSVAIGQPVTVNQPQYYELQVTRQSQSSGQQESTLIQFIVRASERGSTEWGLPLWTPFPQTLSATSEFATGTLAVIAPAIYPLGLDIPIAARVNDPAGKRMGVNGAITASGFETHPLTLLRGVGSVCLPPATAAGDLAYNASIAGLTAPKTIQIESNTPWQSISGALATTNWPAQSRIHVTGQLTIAAGATLTIGAGSVVLIDPDLEITVNGALIVNGTNDTPVVFTTPDRTKPWGGFVFKTAASQGDFTGTILTASGADPSWIDNNASGDFAHHKEQCLFYLSGGAHLTLTDCYMFEHDGQLGHGESSYLTMNRCLVQKFITGGQYNSGGVNVIDSALIEFPADRSAFADDDNDAMYLNGGPHTFTDCLIGWTLDDGFDAGEGATGALIVDGCWFESCIHEALALSSGPRYATIANTVITNCGQAIESGYGAANADADNCFLTANLVGARFGDNYNRTYSGFLDVQNSLLLYNWRDVWGRAWDNWQLHLSQMDIRANFLSVANPNHPDNQLWDPDTIPAQLQLMEPFIPSPGARVGLGFALTNTEQDLADLAEQSLVPIRLSRFTTLPVTVDYTLATNLGLIETGSLSFPPGQTLQQIALTRPPLESVRQVRISLGTPTNADLTGPATLTWQKPYILTQTPIAVGDTWRYFKGTSEPPADWNTQTFSPDATWLSGPAGFGYETGNGYQNCIATPINDMKGNYLSVYFRKSFPLDDPARVLSLTLGINWDDGFIAYLNGARVAAQYPPLIVAHDQPASTPDHESCCTGACPPDRFDLSDYRDLLTPGDNVLAIQLHNTNKTSSDLLLVPELSCTLQPLTGDLDLNGVVDIEDLALFTSTWLAHVNQPNFIPEANLDSNGPSANTIDLNDLRTLSTHWLMGTQN